MTASHRIVHRQLHGIDDVMAVHRFLSDVYERTRDARTWEVRRWEGMFWHDDPDDVAQRLASPSPSIRMWSDGDTIVAVAHPEGGGDVHIQIAPGYAHLEDEMLAWAESTLPRVDDTGRQRLTTFAVADDAHRRQVLIDRGYVRETWHLVQRWRNLDDPLPRVPVASGYELTSLRPGNARDADGLAELINAAFGHAFGSEAILNFERSPSFDAELQILAKAGDGTIAAHAGVTVDSTVGLAIVEPVCTHPDHRRRGLATASMAEGLRRAAERGAKRATVGTGHDNPSNHVYALLGFDDVDVVEAWTRSW